MLMYNRKLTYNTEDEIVFLRGLLTGQASHYITSCRNGWTGRGARPDVFRRYADLILNDRRAWDSTVDVPVVKAAVREMLAGLK